MVLLLTVLSVLAVWALLGLLVVGLLLIFKALDSVRRNLEQIAMGVRAIETETAPLGSNAMRLRDNIGDVTHAVDDLAGSLERGGRILAGGSTDSPVH